MTGDILQRIRSRQNDASTQIEKLLDEAADEIEKLRLWIAIFRSVKPIGAATVYSDVDTSSPKS